MIDEAVDCRNYFVHGSKAKMDYSDEFDQVIFFTEALEFIFAASDFIECGWNIDEWSKQNSTVSHPFDRFRRPDHGQPPIMVAHTGLGGAGFRQRRNSCGPNLAATCALSARLCAGAPKPPHNCT